MRKIRKRTPNNKRINMLGVHLQLTDTVCCTITCGKLENVPQKLRKIICWGTFTTYRYSVMHNYTWKIRKCTPKNDKTAILGYRT